MLGPGQRRLEAAAVGAFVAHGSADDAGAVLVADDAALGAVQRGLQKVGVVGKGLVPVLNVVLPQLVFRAVHLRCAVALVVGLGDDQKTVLVTQLVEHGGVGVVGGADGVEVIFLDHPQIPLHVFQRDHRTGDGIGVVAVDAPELDGVAVEIDLVVLNGDLPEAPAVHDGLLGAFQHQCVQVGLLGIPQGRLADGQQCLMGEGAAGFHGLGVPLATTLFSALSSVMETGTVSAVNLKRMRSAASAPSRRLVTK